MSGYVASARVRGVPRLVRTEPAADRPVISALPEEARVIEVELDGAGRGERALGRVADALAERALAFRERWSQLTFYLFDPNSWR